MIESDSIYRPIVKPKKESALEWIEPTFAEARLLSGQYETHRSCLSSASRSNAITNRL